MGQNVVIAVDYINVKSIQGVPIEIVMRLIKKYKLEKDETSNTQS